MKKLFSRGIVLAALIFTSSCSKDRTANAGMPANDINLTTNAAHGLYLANKQGLSLYMFANDADGISSCTGGCEATWPPLTIDLALAKLDPGLIAADFGTITTAAGKKQVTYKGWPLYTYSPSSTDQYGNAANVPGDEQGRQEVME